MKILILADHWIEEELFLLEPVTVVPEEREYFVWNEDGLSFVAKQKTLWFDFLDKQLHFRLHHLSRKNELLFRALNLKLGERLLDLSAGGGIDSFIIANFGFEVLMIERHWVIYLLLKDALRRLRTLNRFKDLQLNLAFGEAVNYLDKSYPVVYFDPNVSKAK